MTGLAEVLAQHQLVSRGLTYGSPDGCFCGAETLPERGDEDVSVRRNRAFAEHQSAVVAEWLTSDEAVEVVTQAALPYVSYYDDGFPVEAARATLAALAELATGDTDD